MKKRIGAYFLTLCMLLSLMPATVFASGNEEETLWVDTYLELEAALANPTVRQIIILPYQQNEHLENTDPFLWPEDDYTLDLEAASPYANIQLGNGTWTIPEHVTVNAYKPLNLSGHPTDESMDSRVIINGIWNFASNYAGISCGTPGCGAVTVNGTMGISSDVRTSMVSCETFVINGIVNNGGTFRSGDLTLGNGAVIRDIKDPDIKNSEREVRISGTVTCAGSATIEGKLIPSTGNANDSTLILDGDFALKHFAMGGSASSSFTVTEGSYVTVEELSVSSGTVNLNGTMEIVPSLTSFSYAFDGTSSASPVMNMGRNGVLKIGAGLRLDNQDSTGTVTGSGRIELYANLMDYGDNYTRWDDHATLFGLYETAPPQVGEDITIWRCWEDCEHSSWSAPTILEPTCGTHGYDSSFCDACGAKKLSNIKYPTNEHDHSVSYSDSESVELECSKCGYSAYIGIHGSTMTYTGEPLEGAKLYGAGLEWLDYTPVITYQNNIEIGTGTATAVVEGITISTTFEITAGCLHKGGTATCTELAVCELCDKPYGDYAPHVPQWEATCTERAFCSVCWSEYGEPLSHDWVLNSNNRFHWYECSVCEEPATEEETAAAMTDDGLLGLWEALCDEHGVHYSFNTHIFKSDNSCYLCGHVNKPVTATPDIEKQLIDVAISIRGLPAELEAGEPISLVAALYENGQLVGTELKSVTVGKGNTVEESLKITYGNAYAPDRCKVFLLADKTSAPLMTALEEMLN